MVFRILVRSVGKICHRSTHHGCNKNYQQCFTDSNSFEEKICFVAGGIMGTLIFKNYVFGPPEKNSRYECNDPGIPVAPLEPSHIIGCLSVGLGLPFGGLCGFIGSRYPQITIPLVLTSSFVAIYNFNKYDDY